MSKNVYGLDMGSYEIKVYDKNKNRIWKAKDVIAIVNNRDILAVGDDAYEMFEKNPSNIDVSFPMRDGVISKFNLMQFLIQSLLKKDKQARGAEYVLAVPTDITEVEKKAFFDLVVHSAAKAKEVNIVERAIADAVGLNFDVKNTKGLFIINLGGATTEFSVIAGGGLVFNKLLKVGGITFDNAIINLVRNNHDFLIGTHTAETLRKNFGVFTEDADTTLITGGMDLIRSLPMKRNISINLVRSAMKEPLYYIVDEINSMLGRVPPEILNSIKKNGIFLTGGIANTPGIENFIEQSIGIRTRAAVNPDICAVMGIKKIVDSEELSKLAYSMIEENYRWMR